MPDQDCYNILTLTYFILAEEVSLDDKKNIQNEKKTTKRKPYKSNLKPKHIIKSKRLR